MAATTPIRVEPEVADQLTVLGDETGVGRPAFVRLLLTRYGDALRRELTSPARPAAGELLPAAAPVPREVMYPGPGEVGDDGPRERERGDLERGPDR